MEELYEIFLRNPIICTDTRKIEKNSIFFALKGPAFNANSLAKIALEGGCSLAVIDEKKYNEGSKYFLVDDVLKSLQQLAIHHRNKLKIPFIGITGTNGKTTTKELLHSVLSAKFKTAATKGNLNNHIGVPLTVLSVNESTEVAIIEMGANHIGEIANLCSIAKPGFGIITNIGKAHLEGFGSFEGVIKAKTELYDYLRKNMGIVFLNKDNKLLHELSGEIKSISYGISSQNDYMGKIISSDPLVNISWKKKSENLFGEEIKTKLAGSYNFENILSAICVGNYFGVGVQEIKNALENYTPSNNRSQVLRKGSNTIILDCYNANPVSMEAALKNFDQMKGGKKVAILGDMLELGEYSIQEHENIVEILNKVVFEQIILVGKEFSKVFIHDNFRSFLTSEEAKEYLMVNRITNSKILIKGSRGIKLESLVDVI